MHERTWPDEKKRGYCSSTDFGVGCEAACTGFTICAQWHPVSARTGSWAVELIPALGAPLPRGGPVRRCRANLVHIMQSRPDYGLGFQAKVLKRFELFLVRSEAVGG